MLDLALGCWAASVFLHHEHGPCTHTQGAGLALPAERQPGDAPQSTALLQPGVTAAFLRENFLPTPSRRPMAPDLFRKGPHRCFLLSQQDREKFSTDNCDSPD